jgi:hypothetical protein
LIEETVRVRKSPELEELAYRNVSEVSVSGNLACFLEFYLFGYPWIFGTKVVLVQEK